jgi:hypothetical protein
LYASRSTHRELFAATTVQENPAMIVAPRPAQVRALVLSTLQSFGANVFSDLQVEETLLVQDGRCMARSYRTCDHFAMWLVEVGLLQFYNSEGDVLLVLNLLEDTAPGQRIAA